MSACRRRGNGMQVVIRATGSSLRRKRAQRTLTTAFSLTPLAAHAAPPAAVSDSILLLNATIQHHQYAAFAITAGIIVFAVLCAALLVRTRRHAAVNVEAQQHEIAILHGAI